MEDIAPNPRRPIFFWIAMLLAIAAFFLYGIAHTLFERASVLKADHLQQTVQKHITFVEDANEVRMAHAGNILTLTGRACTGTGVACMTIAAARREKGWYLILFGLLMFGLVTMMLL